MTGGPTMRQVVNKNINLITAINTALSLAVLNYAIATEKRFSQLETQMGLVLSTMQMQSRPYTQPESAQSQQPKKDRG